MVVAVVVVGAMDRCKCACWVVVVAAAAWQRWWQQRRQWWWQWRVSPSHLVFLGTKSTDTAVEVVECEMVCLHAEGWGAAVARAEQAFRQRLIPDRRPARVLFRPVLLRPHVPKGLLGDRPVELTDFGADVSVDVALVRAAPIPLEARRFWRRLGLTALVRPQPHLVPESRWPVGSEDVTALLQAPRAR